MSVYPLKIKSFFFSIIIIKKNFTLFVFISILSYKICIKCQAVFCEPYSLFFFFQGKIKEKNISSHILFAMPAFVAQSDAHLTGDQEDAGSIPAGPAKFFHRDWHKMFSKVINSLPLIQEWQLSVSAERMCTTTG